MALEEIERILQTVAENQARHSEFLINHEKAITHLTAEVTRTTGDINLLTAEVTRVTGDINLLTTEVTRVTGEITLLTAEVTRITGDINQIDRSIDMLIQSQNRYEEKQNLLNEIMHDLADKHLKTEEIRAEHARLFAENADAHLRFERRFDQFQDYFQTFTKFVIDYSTQTNGRLNKIDENLDRLTEAQTKTDEQINRTIEQIRALTRGKPAAHKRAEKVRAKKRGSK